MLQALAALVVLAILSFIVGRWSLSWAPPAAPSAEAPAQESSPQDGLEEDVLTEDAPST